MRRAIRVGLSPFGIVVVKFGVGGDDIEAGFDDFGYLRREIFELIDWRNWLACGVDRLE
jgi:hypothetical protein